MDNKIKGGMRILKKVMSSIWNNYLVNEVTEFEYFDPWSKDLTKIEKSNNNEKLVFQKDSSENADC